MRAFLCTPGWEPALAHELARGNRVVSQLAPGVVAIDGGEHDGHDDPVFSRQALPAASVVEGASVRGLAENIFASLDGALDGWPGPLSLHALAHAQPPPGLASRAELCAREVLGLVESRRRRTFRRLRDLQNEATPFDQTCLLIQLLALERERFVVSAAPPRPLPLGGFDLARWPGGDAPVATDRAPPSRAYQKLEEALAWMGRAPSAGELCVDLGAAPGGWTAIAIARGARVLAVDRAPIAPALARHPRVTMTIGNAFTYAPPAPVDWLLCDVVCEPPRSLAIIETWLTRKLCRNLVVTVKFKGRDGYDVLGALPPLFARLRPTLTFARVKQLRHNKNEVTVMVRNADAPAKMR